MIEASAKDTLEIEHSAVGPDCDQAQDDLERSVVHTRRMGMNTSSELKHAPRTR